MISNWFPHRLWRSRQLHPLDRVAQGHGLSPQAVGQTVVSRGSRANPVGPVYGEYRVVRHPVRLYVCTGRTRHGLQGRAQTLLIMPTFIDTSGSLGITPTPTGDTSSPLRTEL